jgi:hypothetical protein
MKENKFLKVMGIIMLVCGVIGAVVSLIPIAWDAILALIGVKLSQMLTLVLGTALLVISVVLQIIAGVGLIGSNLLQFGQELPPFFPVTRMSTLLVESLPWLGIAAGLCVIAFAILCKCHRTPSPLLYMLVSIYLVVRLIVRFQNWNTDPSIHDYAYELLAAICTMLGCFQVAGFGFNKGKRAITAFWCSCAVFFTGISLADALEDLPELCALLSLLILSFTMAIQLLYAREDIEEPTEEAPSAKDLPEEDTPADLPPEDHSPEF